MLMALRFEPSRFFLKGKVRPLPLRKNLLGLKRKAINIYFTMKYAETLKGWFLGILHIHKYGYIYRHFINVVQSL